MKFKDYYQILGVSESSTKEEIKRAYRKKARQYHPDVSKESDAEEKFKSISEAYEVLKDEKRRAEYDQLKKHGFSGGDDFRRPPNWKGDWNFDRGGFGQSGQNRGSYSWGGQGDFSGNSDFSDFFESIFGQAGFDSAARRPGHNPGYSGGQGKHTAGHGAGRHSKGDDINLSVRVSLEEAYRGGKTKVKVPAATGYPEKTLNVNIPAGVTDGQQLRLRGQGRPGAINGDLILKIQHKPHDLFAIDGSHVILNVPVTPLELIEGATLKVPTLSGRVSVKIPPGTISGKRLRIKGKGLPGSSAGDLIVTVQVAVPEDLDADSIQQLRQIEASWEFDPRAHFERVENK